MIQGKARTQAVGWREIPLFSPQIRLNPDSLAVGHCNEGAAALRTLAAEFQTAGQSESNNEMERGEPAWPHP